MPERVLVLGGTGLLGPEVCRTFLAQGAEVRAFHRGRHPQRLPRGVQSLLGDRRDPRDLAVLARTAADVVIDTMGWFPETLPQVLERLRGRIRLYVLVSSVAVYRGGAGLLTEESPTGAHPVWGAFGLVKRRCEEACEAAIGRGLPAVVLRLSHLCGSLDPASREGRLAALLRCGREVEVPDEGGVRLQFVTLGDVARLCVRLAAALPPSRHYNVTAPRIWTIREWIEEAGRRIGRRPAVRGRPFAWAERDRFLYWPGDVVVDAGRLAREVGFRVPPAVPFPCEEIHHEESDPLLSRDQPEDRRQLRPALAP